MDTIQIEILDPKARKLLKNLADMNLIAIKKPSDDDFLSIVNRIRAKARKDAPTLEEITAEVEIVRAKNHANSKKQSNH